LKGNRTVEPVSLEKMSTAPTLAVHNKISQAVILKSIVPNSEYFDDN